MTRLGSFILGLAIASMVPASAAQVSLYCQPVIQRKVDCTPLYNPLPLECHRT